MSGVRALVLDCDGVILDTNHAKVEAFRETAREFRVPEDTVTHFIEWQSANFGTSRFAAFEKLSQGDFGPAPKTEVELLAQSFAEKVDAIYDRAIETEGLRHFLLGAADTPKFVASGSEQLQLRRAFRTRGLEGLFNGIFGSPTKKANILANIVESLPFRAVETLMIGDAHADADAAQNAGARFIFMNQYSLVQDTMLERAKAEPFPVIRNLAELTLI